MAKLVSSWSNNVETLPTDFIMPTDRRPGKFVEVGMDIPVIDLGLAGNHHRAGLVQQILQASQEFGMFQVINHGVSKDIMEDAKNVYKELFNMSVEDKAGLYSEDLTKSGCRLYTSGADYRKEDAHLWKDTLQHYCHPLEQHISSWPEKPAQFRYVVGRYAVQQRKLGLIILDLIGEGLGLTKGYFEGDLTGRQIMSINHYPPCPDPSLAMGIHAHLDPNLITLLHQEIAGLQILKDDKWIGVEALPNAFVVNGGCQLEIISNGRIRSVEHRAVTNSRAARTSVGTFFVPNDSAVVKPAKELITLADPAKYKASVYLAFQETWFGYYSQNFPRVGTPLDPHKI